MGISARELLRQKGTPYDALGLADPKWTEDELIDFMLEHPILINRPIVETPKGARLCRPSEAVLDILPNPDIGDFTKEDGEVVVGKAARSPSILKGLPMTTIQIFDPALCCSTGVCGVETDQALITFAADVDWAKQNGAQIERFNLGAATDGLRRKRDCERLSGAFRPRSAAGDPCRWRDCACRSLSEPRRAGALGRRHGQGRSEAGLDAAAAAPAAERSK